MTSERLMCVQFMFYVYGIGAYYIFGFFTWGLNKGGAYKMLGAYRSFQTVSEKIRGQQLFIYGIIY